MREIVVSKSAFREVKQALLEQGQDQRICGPRIELGDFELREGLETYSSPSAETGMLPS